MSHGSGLKVETRRVLPHDVDVSYPTCVHHVDELMEDARDLH